MRGAWAGATAAGWVAVLMFSIEPAAAQVAPRFVIAFDTSGSMALDLDGDPTYGDGVLTNCSGGGSNSNPYCGTNCTAGIDTDCNGLPDDSRIYVATEAVTQTILGFGDVEWALARFPQEQGHNLECRTVNDWECRNAISSFGNPQCNTGSVFGEGSCLSDIPSSCRPGSGGRPRLRRWSNSGGGSPRVCINYRGDCGVGDLLVGFPDMGPFLGMDNTSALLRWMDHEETFFINTRVSGNFCDHAGAGDCELRAVGTTPLEGLIEAAGSYMEPIREADPQKSCRNYSILLITDGEESCGGDPIARAAYYRARGIRTYVVGLSISPSGRSQLNAIAQAGGTGAPGPDIAFFANDPVTLSAGLAQIVADSLVNEVCNGLDDDCDGRIDEGLLNACGTCGPPPAEVCNGLDDDCDGKIDEGVQNRCGGCGPEPVEICNGIDDDCDGPIDEGGVCDGCTPTPEACDGLDNDCDGRIDEGLTRSCGSDVGACRAGIETCSHGSWSGCTAIGPSPEVCDGIDNDCDGVIDGHVELCGSDVGACQPGTRICIDGAFGACVGEVGPSPEVCDGLDNDCDGAIDEGNPGGGGSCGSNVGLCSPGVFRCVAGALVCDGAVGPGVETCDGRDEDCDGLVDENVPTAGSCGSDVGACRPGVLSCVAGEFVCVGGSAPRPESCNGLDDDCDGRVDEEDSGGGGVCGSDVGECVPGRLSCVDGTLVCTGSVGPSSEVCDGLDNDCDGRVDEGLGLGAACGSTEGLCMEGAYQCIEGREVCVGDVPPRVETCDCEDNDCDGKVDEEAGGALCPEGSVCVDCQCALPCVPSEFGFLCPTGRTAFEHDGECHCVAERCKPERCAGETITQDGEVRCAPDDPNVSHCVCRNNECTFPCEGVLCPEGTVCNPRDPFGRCVERSCRALGCPDAELCDPVSGECGPDPCAEVSCAADEACRAGECERSCAHVECGEGERCTRGECVPEPCAGLSCGSREVCEAGECVPDACIGKLCPAGTVCASGECVAHPCLGLRCPADEVCIDGDCWDPAALPGVDAGPGPDTLPDAGLRPGDRVLVGGGCACRAGAPVGPSSSSGLLLGVIFVLLFALRRRTRPRRASALSTSFGREEVGRRIPAERARSAALAIALSSLLGGCSVDPFCLSDCEEDEEVDAGQDAGPLDAGPPDSGPPPDAGQDAGPQYDGCVPGAPELCNDEDDDCDGEVDEGIDKERSLEHCGGCGNACAPAHAFGACVEGSCLVASCDVGYHDLDGDPENGCEYRCLPTASDDSLCDLKDDDCDGRIDEDVDFDTDPLNCGACGQVCSFAHAGASCEAGVCTLGDCEPGHHDLDGDPENGCEYACTPSVDGLELCDGLDNDCDGRIDEGDPGGGALCGETTGECSPGVRKCIDGSLRCIGATGPSPELCDGLDNDCDGKVDEGNPGGGGSCGTAEGECTFGVQVCAGGLLTCVGGSGPSLERCDGLDNDCDGRVDEDFDLSGDRLNCGACGNVCSIPNAIDVCSAGSCVKVGCLPGFHNLDGDLSNGCEYACNINGAEVCNGLDDDCDGKIDEGLTPPSNLCSPNGVCAGTTPTCEGAGGWVCNYPSSYQDGGETRCDGLDNDCDGFVDESFPLVGTSCSNGIGECRTTGVIVCNEAGDGTRCTAPPARPSSPEACDGLDNDCDGKIDEEIHPSNIPTVTVPRPGGGTFDIFAFEASRPDATSTTSGTTGTVACSRENVLPWTNVTWEEANAACCALNPSGTCRADERGWRLCDAEDWEAACEGQSASCSWGYAMSCSSSQPLSCNGREYDHDPSTPGVQNQVAPTGSPAFAMCYADWGSGGIVYDLSGNVKEWTYTAAAPDVYQIRGGAYNNVENGRTCSFSFTTGPSDFAFPTTGFRCCRY